MYCHVKVGDCKNPTNCGVCPYFLDVVNVDCLMVCVRCIQNNDKVASFYQAGHCDRCDKDSAALIAVQN